MKEKINIRKLKRHKKPLICLFLIVIAVILFAVIISNGRKRNEKQQAMYQEEQNQLTDMTGYLNEIDDTVTANREHLAEAALLQSDTGETLVTVSEVLSSMDTELTTIETSIREYTEKQTVESEKIMESLSALSEYQKEVKTQIDTVNASITGILSDIKAANENSFLNTFEKLTKLQDTLAQAEKTTETYYKSLSELIKLLQEEDKAEHAELLETLLTAQKEISDLMADDFAALNVRLDEDIADLMQKLNSLHEQIAAASTSISDLLLLMEENDVERQEEIKAAFAAVGDSLEQIKEDYGNAHTEIQNLIKKVQETQTANHEETLSVLTVMESNMEETSMENLNQITNSLQEMENNFSASISSMQNEMTENFTTLNQGVNQSISEYNSSMLEEFRQLNNNIVNQYNDLSSTVNNYDSNQQANFDNLINAIDQRLQSVFQSVSDGKRLLASALLTKGVSCAEDATFREIYEAILNIKQTLVIGVDKLPGTIEYEYHYHTDGSGNYPHSSSIGYKGGCYTSPIYHTHSGSSSSGGGCYTVAKTGYRTYGCGGADCTSGPHGPDSSGNVYYVGNCSGCGKTLSVYGSPGWAACDNTTTVSYTYYELGCGQSTSTVIGYKANCGLSDGQIIGAHIIYDESALSK